MKNRITFNIIPSILAIALTGLGGGLTAQENKKEIDLNSIKSNSDKLIDLFQDKKKTPPKKKPSPDKSNEMSFEEIELFDEDSLVGMWEYSLYGKDETSHIVIGRNDQGATFPIKTPPISGDIPLQRNEDGKSTAKIWDKVRKEAEESSRPMELLSYATALNVDLKELPTWQGEVKGGINAKVVILPINMNQVHGFWIVTVPITEQIMNFEMFVLDRTADSTEKPDKDSSKSGDENNSDEAEGDK